MKNQKNAIAEELRVCGELDTLLLDELADLLNEPVDSEATSWTRSSLVSLCEKVGCEFQLEGNEDYLATVLEEFPNWDNRVEALRRRRGQLQQQLQRVRLDLEDPNAQNRLLRRCRDMFHQWILEYLRHRRAERDLLQEALITDVGVGD